MRKHIQDYEIVPTTDENGREGRSVVYRGLYFEFIPGEEEMVRFKRRSLLILAAIIVLHVCGGLLRNQGMFQLYVSLPYVFAFLPLWYMASGILRLPARKRRYRRDEIDLSVERVKTASIVLLFLLGMAVVGEIVFLATAAPGEGMDEYLFVAGEGLALAALAFLVRLQRGIGVRPCVQI